MQKDRVCVQKCPLPSDKRLSCVPTDGIGCTFSNNPNFTVTYYDNAPESRKKILMQLRSAVTVRQVANL